MRSWLTSCLTLLMVVLAVSQARADLRGLDYPHNFDTRGIGCNSCHYFIDELPDYVTDPPNLGDLDDTVYNRMCVSCHNSIYGAPVVQPHSSLTTSDQYVAEGMPGWALECRVCHWPHHQKQVRAYGVDTYLATGVSTGVTETTLSKAEAGWTPDVFKGKILIPDTGKISYQYKITGNTADTITVSAPIVSYGAQVGKTFAVIHGKLIKDKIRTPNSGERVVKFFRPAGANSFADGDATYDGICEVCHTLTKHYRNNGSGREQGHENLSSSVNGQDCFTTCHSHEYGFKHGGANCADCHNTGSHPGHLTDAGLSCARCHNTDDMPTFKDGGTTKDNTTVCADCHQDGTVVSTTPIKVEKVPPDWESGTTLTCSACHDNPPAYNNGSPKANSHAIHDHLGCQNCHVVTTANGTTVTDGVKHANNVYNLTAGNGITFSYIFSATGGTCSTISCHGGTSATWGTSGCLGCHELELGAGNRRAAIGPQFRANSHHVQPAVGSVGGGHCHQCHWEANADGGINSLYHGGSRNPGQPEVDLVIYGAGTRPLNYGLGTTAIRYTANGSRTEIAKINDHCLGCHSEQNNTDTKPFGDDDHAPNAYAWDGYSVGIKYTSTAKTTWGKYTDPNIPNAAKKNIFKAYSAHGNPTDNYGGGWPDNPSSCFGPDITQAACAGRGTWDAVSQQCDNLAQAACEQNFCTGLTAGQCGTIGGTMSGAVCVDDANPNTATSISVNGCTGYCALVNSWEDCDNDDNCWWEYDYYTTLGLSEAACRASADFDAWIGYPGTYKAGGKYSEGVDLELNPTRGGANAKKVACFDCHNSHGSRVEGRTTSYGGGSGGILKDTTATKGGYAMAYMPGMGGDSATKNAYNPGAGLCFDCHLTASAGAKPWGYSATFGATQPVMGYWDTAYFGPGTFGAQARYPYKAAWAHKGGHLGASAVLSSPPDETHRINGLCSACHDPHGVSPSLGGNQQFGVPLLKGTWVTSPYKEDTAPANNVAETLHGEGLPYHIDQNTFGSTIIGTGPVPENNGISQDVTKFAGLCLNCHPKSSLTDEPLHPDGAWKSKGRIHETVKGWGSAEKHTYTCSKCHTPHNSRLPRLMVTNCLNANHKGRVTLNGAPVISDFSHAVPDCYREPEHEYCDPECWQSGSGTGRIPGSGASSSDAAPWNDQSHGDFAVKCHEQETGNGTDQTWNTVTPWAEAVPVISSGPAAASTPMGSTVRATITWTTGNSYSTSYVDYGLTASYGSTTGNPTLGLNHSIVLDLANHSDYHYRVRSTSAEGQEAVSGDYTFSFAYPPSGFTVVPRGYEVCPTVNSPCSVTVSWNAATFPANGLVDYQVAIDTASTFNTGNLQTSEWIAAPATSWSPPLATDKTWYFKVRARDRYPQPAVSAWSGNSSFSVLSVNPPPVAAPTLSWPAESGYNGQVGLPLPLQWNAASGATEYYCEYWNDYATYNSGWTTALSFNPGDLLPDNVNYWWRVKARNAGGESGWSAIWTWYDFWEEEE